MIKSVICDRCGKEIHQTELILLSTADSPAAMLHTVGADGATNSYIDLCPECLKSFHEWMSGKD